MTKGQDAAIHGLTMAFYALSAALENKGLLERGELAHYLRAFHSPDPGVTKTVAALIDSLDNNLFRERPFNSRFSIIEGNEPGDPAND